MRGAVESLIRYRASPQNAARAPRPLHDSIWKNMARETCYRCFWPKALCWCESIQPMPTRTRFVFLMHPKEFKQEKAATGRLTHLCLPDSENHMGIAFDDDEEVQSIIASKENFPVLLYPGENARDLSRCELTSAELGARRLVVFVLDATWACARKMLNLSPSLRRLPRLKFATPGRSRYVIKQQPQDGCLSTLEATHALLLALERAGLDRYPLPEQLPALFDRMQEFQIKCAADPARRGYRRSAYKAPGERSAPHGRSGARRSRFLK
jgi:DTW domain-containing protein YfiP